MTRGGGVPRVTEAAEIEYLAEGGLPRCSGSGGYNVRGGGGGGGGEGIDGNDDFG
jgi:hypothetical protein